MERISVFCGSAKGKDPAFALAAAALGKELAARKITLVYGGGNIGLMGIIADAVLAHQGQVIGVIPGFMMAKEIDHPGLTELRIVSSMHERKATMAELSDGFIALPGGFGTLEEFCEILSWAQLGLHCKPFGILSTAGYYQHFLAFLDHAVGEGLLKSKHRALVIEAQEPIALVEKMLAWKPAAPAAKWLERPSQT